MKSNFKIYLIINPKFDYNRQTCSTGTGKMELFSMQIFCFSILGPELWKILLSLKKTYDIITNAVIITSDVISKNGFRIELTEGKSFNIHQNPLNDLEDVTCRWMDRGMKEQICRMLKLTT
jgi:hypothetical protein